jgi:hypothetical protein
VPSNKKRWDDLAFPFTAEESLQIAEEQKV